MKKEKIFCIECRSEVDYIEKDIVMSAELKGNIYRYNGKSAYCVNCDEEIYVPELNDYNLKALYDEYRTHNGIISLEKIIDIPIRYAIGKRPLSLLLGWGEQTFSRYCDGDLPSKQYSIILEQIYNDPGQYSELLENNKAVISPAAYEKSRRAIDLILKNGSEVKINQVVQYILSQCLDTTPLSLQKALYYVQGFFNAFYNKFMFDADCEAWVHGPVYRKVYARYCDYRYNTIDAPKCFDDSVFSAEEKSILDSVVKNLCCYSGTVLEQFTHKEAPWIETRGDLPVNAISDKVIDKKLINDFFVDVKRKYNMISPADISQYTQYMFKQL